jgi:nitrilase
VIVGPDGNVLAGPVREREETLIAELDLRAVAAQRRHMDPTGHYNRPDIFRLVVDTSARQAVIATAGEPFGATGPAPPTLPA